MACAVAIRGFGLGDHDAGDTIALGVAALTRQSRELFRHQRLQLVDSHRIDALPSTKESAQTLERRCGFRRRIAALLRPFHLGAAFFQLAAESFEFPHRTVWIELRI